jgi:mRNA-degrading endonuclease RelE of RelBE toxin-antitoxin system
MTLEWTFTAESYLDQLSPEERSKVLHAVERLPVEWGHLGGARLNQLEGEENLYSLRVGADLRVLVRRRNDVVTVVDVVRRSQVDGLRRLANADAA